MDSLGVGGLALGSLTGLLVLLWILASILIPFLIWGIYNQTRRARIELEAIKALLASQKSATAPHL